MLACNLINRLFRRRRQAPGAFAAPALPSSSDKLEDLEQLPSQFEKLTSNDDPDYFYLGHLAEQGSFTLVLLDIPREFDTAAIVARLEQLPGYISRQYQGGDSQGGLARLFVNFSTAEEAASAMATEPSFDVGNGVRRHLQYAQTDDREDAEPARKKLKNDQPTLPRPHCLICGEEVDDPYSRPCFRCKAPWCHECLRNQFKASLDDHERFPAQCCGSIIHYDTARGVIADADHSTYRTRFEQYHTTRPVYCANVRCSIFLPPRMAKPDERGQVTCPQCEHITCPECKLTVDAQHSANHKCVEADATAALLKQFDYKRCPRCNTGVAKMFGCSHVRCQCGAHWCWDCQRPIQICWAKPCERAQEDGDHTDEHDVPEDDESDSDSEAEQTTTAPTTNAAAPTEPSVSATEVTVQVTAEQEPDARPVTDASAQPSVDEPATTAADPRPDATPGTAAAQEISNAESQAQNTASTQEPVVNPNDEPATTGTDPSAGTATAEEVSNAESQAQNTSGTQESVVNPDDEPATTGTDPGTGTATAQEVPNADNQTQNVASTHESLVNLDHEDADDWEGGDYDFGDEPIDEAWDTWGCMHHFNPVADKLIWNGQPYWLPNSEVITSSAHQPAKQIDCLKCYKTIVVTEPATEAADMPVEKPKERKDSACDVSEGQAQEAAALADAQTSTTDLKVKKKRKAAKSGEMPKLFNCFKCGTFYCASCKKTTAKEIKVLLEQRLYSG